jgi:hypothetical protein
MGERLLGLAATTLAGQFLWRAAGRAAESRGAELQATESRAVESRVVRRAETLSASASDGSCATNLAMAGRTSESAAAARVAVRLVEGVFAARKVGRSSESIARELADEVSRGFLRARSHFGLDPLLENFVELFAQVGDGVGTAEVEGFDGSLGRGEEIFERPVDGVLSRRRNLLCVPLELGVGLIGITRVITSYSIEVEVLVRGAGVGLAVRTNAEMRPLGRRFTDTFPHG